MNRKLPLMQWVHLSFLLLMSAGMLACIPSTTRTAANTSTNKTTSSTSIGSTATTSSDGAQGQCLNIDSSRPERAYCVQCYSEILSSRCPGASAPSACLDRTVASTFTQLVNQCITQSVVAGFVCSKACANGTTLNATTCQCVASSSSSSGSGTGVGSSAPVDTGQIDYGPPLVNVFWPGLSSLTTPGSQVISCKATAPVLFEIQNRGNSIPKLNTNRFQQIYPSSGANAASRWLSVTNPTYQATTDSVRSTLTIQSGPSNSGAYTDFVFFDDFESVADRTANFSSTAIASNTRLTKFLGPFKQAEALTLSVAALPSGPYLLFFDAYLIQDWQGSNPVPAAPGLTPSPHVFSVRMIAPTTATLFEYSLSSSPYYGQTYPGAYTFQNVMTGYPALPDTLPEADFPIASRLNLKCPGNGGAGPCSLQVTFAGKNLTSATTQLWGIDNVGLMPLRELAVKYSFTDTNQQTSSYCMFMEIYNTCGNPGTANPAGGNVCTCWAGPKRSLVSGETFSSIRTDDSLACPVANFPAVANPLPAAILRIGP